MRLPYGQQHLPTGKHHGSRLAAMVLLSLLALLTLWAPPAAAGSGTGLVTGTGIKTGTGPAAQMSRFLPAEEAFVLEYGWHDERNLRVRWHIAPGYYLYRHRLQAAGEGFALPELPIAIRKTDEYFGDTEVYYDSLDLQMVVLDDAPQQLRLELQWQGCAEAGLCYLTQSHTLQLERPDTAGGAPGGSNGGPDGGQPVALSADQSALAPNLPSNLASDFAPDLAMDEQLAAVLAAGKHGWTILLFLALGLLLAFTPCVLPMVPILSGLLVGAGTISRSRALLLSACYVFAMALTYALIGTAVAAFGVGLQAAMQSPWVLGAFCALLVAMALSMFGLYDIRVPGSLQRWLADKSGSERSGSPAGAGVMGLLSALIVGPCIAPPLVGALLYISQTGDMLLGGLALFSFGLGMGLPLLLAGAALGSLLPHSGAWMKRIQQLFGFALLGLAVWFSERVLQQPEVLLLWLALGLMLSIWLLSIAYLTWRQRRDAAAGGQWRVPALALLALAVLWAGLANLLVAIPAGDEDAVLYQHQVRSPMQLQEVLQRQTQPILLDIYADWCVECKRISREVLPQAAVRQALKGWVLVKVDVTANDADARELLAQYGLLGPPTLVFLDARGNERRSLRTAGYIGAEALIARLRH